MNIQIFFKYIYDNMIINFKIIMMIIIDIIYFFFFFARFFFFLNYCNYYLLLLLLQFLFSINKYVYIKDNK